MGMAVILVMWPKLFELNSILPSHRSAYEI